MAADQAGISDYYRSYNLEQDPFPVDHADAVYYASPELEHRLELVKHLVDFSDRILLVTADDGVGKTAFLQRLQAEADERWRIIWLTISGGETVESVLAGIFEQNHLTFHQGESVPSCIAALSRQLENNARNNLVNVLLVDDAHLATAGVLNLLLQIARPEPADIQAHLVMLSAEDIAELFRNQDNEFVHKMDLPLLSEEQVADYIQFRLDAVGFDQSELFFDDARIRQIHKTSGGNPALVNQLAARVLQEPSRLAGKAREKTSPPLAGLLLNARVTLIVALLLAAVFVVFTLNRETPEQTETVSVTLPGTMTGKPQQSVVDELPEPLPAGESATGDDGALASDVKAVREEDTGPEDTPATPEIPAPVPEPAPLVTEVPEEPTPPETGAPTEQPSVEPEPTSVTVVEEPVEKPVQEETVVETPPQEVEAAGKAIGLKDSAWLNQQSPDKYVLQIMGAHDPEVLTRLLSSNPSIYDNVARFTTVNNNKRWHVLVFGLYDNHDAAVAGIESLPKNLRALGPWPRTIASIQEDLR